MPLNRFGDPAFSDDESEYGYLFESDSEDEKEREEKVQPHRDADFALPEDENPKNNERIIDLREEEKALKISNDIKRLLYLGSILVKKCDGGTGANDKEIKDRLEILIKSRKLPKTCDLRQFKRICRLKEIPDYGKSCQIELDDMIKKFLTYKMLIKYIYARFFDYDVYRFLLDNDYLYDYKFDTDILKAAIYADFPYEAIEQIMDIIEANIESGKIEKPNYEGKDPETFVKINFLGKYQSLGKTSGELKRKIKKIKELDIAEALFQSFDNEDMYFYKRVIEMLNLSTDFYYLRHLNLDLLVSHDNLEYFYQRMLKDSKSKNVKTVEEDIALNFIPFLIEILQRGDHQYWEYEIDDWQIIGIRDLVIDIIQYFKHTHKKFYQTFLVELYDMIKDFAIFREDLFEIFQELNILPLTFDINKYADEYYLREYDRQALGRLNVHNRETNSIVNKYIRALGIRTDKILDPNQLDEIRPIAENFINYVNNKNINMYAITTDDVMLCSQRFYDFDDEKQRPRDTIPDGQGVEPCYIFTTLWSRALDRFGPNGTEPNDEKLEFYANRLLEEIVSILDIDWEGNRHPVCGTGYASRYINSLKGSALDLDIKLDPSEETMRIRINDFVRQKNDKLQEEVDKFQESLAGEDDYFVVKEYIMKELTPEIIKEFENTDFSRTQVVNTLWQTMKKMF